MQRLSSHQHYINMVIQLNEGQQGRIRLNNDMSRAFPHHQRGETGLLNILQRDDEKAH